MTDAIRANIKLMLDVKTALMDNILKTLIVKVALNVHVAITAGLLTKPVAKNVHVANMVMN